jgi:hypothetical protein
MRREPVGTFRSLQITAPCGASLLRSGLLEPIFQLSVADHYISWQSTSTLLVSPLVTVTGPDALQSAVPPSYCGLCPETVYVPSDAGTENRPFAPTEMRSLVPFDP